MYDKPIGFVPESSLKWNPDGHIPIKLSTVLKSGILSKLSPSKLNPKQGSPQSSNITAR